MKRCLVCRKVSFDDLERCPHNGCGGRLVDAGPHPSDLGEALEEIASMNPRWPFEREAALSNLTDLAPNLSRERSMLKMFFTALGEVHADRLFVSGNLEAAIGFASEFLTEPVTDLVRASYGRLQRGPDDAGTGASEPVRTATTRPRQDEAMRPERAVAAAKASKEARRAVEDTRRLALLGKVDAQVRLAEMYLGGNYADFGIPQDVTEALGWFVRAARSGAGEAAWGAACALKRLGRSEALVAAWQRRAMELGSSEARAHLEEYRAARAECARIAEIDNLSEEHISLLIDSERALVTDMILNNPRMLVPLLRSVRFCALEGSTAARIHLAWGLTRGDEEDRDPLESACWLELTLEAPDDLDAPLAATTLAGIYDEMHHYADANWWYERAFDVYGNTGAGTRVAANILAARGAAGRTEERAFSILQETSKEDRCGALFWLGFCYEYGAGTARDAQLALECYREAASNGQPEAAKRVQKSAEELLGRARSYERAHQPGKAFSLYSEAAKLGLPEAQYLLGVSYEFGDGVEKDLEKARLWYGRAASGGHQRAADAAAALGRR